MENNNEEMDLISLMRWMFGGVKNFFKGCLNACGSMLKLCYRNKLIILVFLLLGIGVGLYMSFPKVYRGECILKAPSSHLVKSMVNEFDGTKYNNGSNKAISKLNLSPELAAKISLIRPYSVITSKDDPNEIKKIAYKDKDLVVTDTLLKVSGSRICLQFLMKSDSDFVTLQNSIISYLNKVPEIEAYNSRQAQYLNSLLQSIDNELSKLDSLSKVDYFGKDSKRTRMQLSVDTVGVTLGEKDKKLYHNDIFELQSKRDSVTNEIQTMQNGSVSVVTPMLVKKYPYNFWLKEIIIFGGLFFVFGIFVAAFWENRKKIKQYLEEK